MTGKPSKNVQFMEGVAKHAQERRPRRGSVIGATVGAPHVQGRENAIAQITSGKNLEKTLHWVDPKRCRMWSRHNRRYDLLSEASCADLIEGLKRQSTQEFPAVVRRIMDDPSFDYEVICGARRHWSISWLRQNNYPQFEFLIEVRELSDEEAFRLSDSENRDRQDITDYERALDYLAALSAFYRDRQSEMAERLEVSDAWLSRYLDLARLPKEIVDAYANIAEIKVRHARALKPPLKNADSRKRVLDAGRSIAQEQAKARAEGRAVLNGQTVLARLLAAPKARSRSKSAEPTEYRTRDGKPMLTAERKRGRGLVVKVLPSSGATKEELLEAFASVVESYLG